MSIPYTLFISDLHLAQGEALPSRHFTHCLNTYAANADALYILGDLFDLWLGDDKPSVFEQGIINQLKTITDSGTPVFLMVGNHDFLIGQSFAKKSGVTLIPDPSHITLYDASITLCHGDSLCTNDTRHIRFRKLIHNRCLQRLFTCLSKKTRQQIAEKIQHRDRNTAYDKDVTKFSPTTQGIEALLHQHPADYLIHGHTHTPCIEDHTGPKGKITRINLGHGHGQAKACYFNQQQEFRLVPMENS